MSPNRRSALPSHPPLSRLPTGRFLTQRSPTWRPRGIGEQLWRSFPHNGLTFGLRMRCHSPHRPLPIPRFGISLQSSRRNCEPRLLRWSNASAARGVSTSTPPSSSSLNNVRSARDLDLKSEPPSVGRLLLPISDRR